MVKSKKSIVVFGKNGQLGRSLQDACHELPDTFSFIFLDRTDGDICNIEHLKAIKKKYNPSYIINCAAYTAVDNAEEEQTQCYKVNEIGVKNIAEVFGKSACIIHYSTDYVYNTNIGFPLYVKDKLEPISVYAKSKLKGEEALKSLAKRHIIIRTSWVYSQYGNNFVKTMLKLALKTNEINVVEDQIGAPTFARDIADATFKIIQKIELNPSNKKYYGIFNYANEGTISWYDFAKYIFAFRNIDMKVNNIPTTSYPLPASRPRWSKMNLSKIKRTFNLEIPHWTLSLKKCLSQL
jgi:dTDP-4-dehydrorhamnose reductase